MHSHRRCWAEINLLVLDRKGQLRETKVRAVQGRLLALHTSCSQAVVLKVCPVSLKCPWVTVACLSKSMAARRSDKGLGSSGLPPFLHWLSDLFPVSPLSAVWLSSPVPTEVVSGEAKAVHVSRMPMGENKAAAR